MKAVETSIEIDVSDVSDQKKAHVRDVPREATVSELVNELLTELGLPQQDVKGRPLSYAARRQRDGQQLHGSERVGEALQTGDHIVLLPSIDAG